VVNPDKASKVVNPDKASEAISPGKASRVVNPDSNSPRRAARVRQTMKKKTRIATVNAAHPSFSFRNKVRLEVPAFSAGLLCLLTSFFADSTILTPEV
jgi:hypothetical protein